MTKYEEIKTGRARMWMKKSKKNDMSLDKVIICYD